MEYLSTKELSEKWGIDTSRILRLAKEGRISGARRIGNSWAFPSEAQRLPDLRRKENRAKDQEKVFRFPLYFYCRYSAEEQAAFTEDERILYEAEKDGLKCDYSTCSSTLAVLKDRTEDLTVKLGAIYVLCMCCIYQKKYSQAASYFQELKNIFQKEFPHKKVLVLLLHDLESYFTGNSFYLENFTITLDPVYMPQLRDYFILQIAFSAMVRAFFKNDPVDPMPYELYCMAEEQTIMPYPAALLHLYVAFIWQRAGNRENTIAHLCRSCSIAEENRFEHVIAFAMQYSPEMFHAALQEKNPEQLLRLQKLAMDETDSFNGLQESLDKHNVLHQLDAADTKFVLFAEQGMTNKEISAVLGLSVNTISKRYSVLFEKTGTHSKKELVQLYTEAMRYY